MGFFDLFRKKTIEEKIATSKTNCFGESLEHLDAEGNLPFGWIVHNKKYVDMINREVNVFTEKVHSAKSVTEKYNALKSLLQYFEDRKAHYKKMDVCVGKYFDEYICNSEWAQGYRESFQNMDSNFQTLIEEEKKMIARRKELDDLKEEIFQNLKGNDGIMQSEFVNMFYESKKSDCRFLLAELEKEKRIERTKSGRSYLLHI